MDFRKFGLIYLLFIAQQIHSQVSQEELIERLYHTCKVWGYLKYHHSNLTMYNSYNPPVDWDDAFLSSIHGIMTAKDKPSFEDSLNVLLFKAGSLNDYIDYWGYRGDSINQKDFSWHQDSYLPKNVKDTLTKIRRLFKNQAIGYFSNNELVGFPFIKFDNKFHTDTSTNLSIRLLGLFRYWNLIEYTYQHKPSLNPNWDKRLKLVLKDLLDAQTDYDYIFVMKKLTKSIEDSRAHFRHPLYQSYIGDIFTPFKLRFIDGKTIVVNKPDSIQEISIGDEVTYIEEEPIDAVRARYREFAEGSNTAAIERNVDELICRGKPYTAFAFKKSNGQSVYYNTIRKKDNITYWNHIPATKPIYDTTLAEGCSFGVIDFRKINNAELNTENLESIWYKDAWILDFRGLPFVSFESFFIRYIYNEYKEYIYYREPNLQIPGEFYSQKIYNIDYLTHKTPRYSKKIILLVDEYTQKEAEYFALCFMERENVLVIGSQTDGAGAISLAQVYLPGGIYTTYTYKGAQNGQKISYHKHGVRIDSFARPSLEDIRNGRDVVMQAALKCSNSRLGISQNEPEPMSLYPNPVNNMAYIDIQSLDEIQCEIYNLLGKKIMQLKLGYEKNEIQLSNLSEGIYFLKIGNQHIKFIKQ